MSSHEQMDSYPPLKGDEIRLISLQRGRFSDRVQMGIQYHSLAACPKYDALSYSWGDTAKDKAPPEFRDGGFFISARLELALKHLRDPFDNVLLWVDAICINQQDVQEKSIQVTRIRDIYEQAQRVIIWLGECAPHTTDRVNSAFALARTVYDLLQGRERVEGRAGVPDEEHDVYRTLVGRESDVDVLREIVHRRWFGRAWVMQETAVCKTPESFHDPRHQPEFVVGRSRIPFSTLLLSCSLMAHTPQGFRIAARPPDSGVPARGKLFNLAFLHGMRQLRNGLLTGQVKWTQAEQLVVFATRASYMVEATDERDMLYALLGLLSSRTLPDHLRPDYRLAAEEVFLHYAAHMIRETGYLDILACKSGPRPGLPSWVPDWKRGEPMEMVQVGKIANVRFVDHDRKLEVECVTVDRVVKVTRPVDWPIPDCAREFSGYDHPESGLEEQPLELEEVEDLAKLIAHTYLALLTTERAWFGCRAYDARLTRVQLTLWVAAMQHEFEEPDMVNKLHRGYSSYQLYCELMNLEKGDLPTNHRFVTAMGSYCVMIAHRLRHPIFQDPGGRFGCLRSEAAQPEPGDRICFFKGATHQFLIRPVSGGTGWQLIGAGRRNMVDMFPPGYVHQVGRWAELWDSKKEELQRIILH